MATLSARHVVAKKKKPLKAEKKSSRGQLFLTPKQQLMLSFIQQFREERGYSPTQREIANHFGFKSLGTIQNYLVRLKKGGAIEKEWNQKRDLVLSDLAHANTSKIDEKISVRRIPLVGFVAAGRPIEAIENHEMMEIPGSMTQGRGPFFMLKVKGDSMIGDGILEGDFVIIKKQAEAQNGQTVVALVDNQATIKKFIKRGGHVELVSSNPAYAPIIVKDGGFRLEGVLIAVMRRFS